MVASELPRALLELSDTSGIDDVDGYARRLVRCSLDLTRATAAAVVLRDDHGRLRVGAARPDWIRALPEAAIASGTGPAVECCRSLNPVCVPDVTECDWPGFAEMARGLGISGGYATPLHRGERVFGALAVYCDDFGAHRENIVCVCRALAAAAAIALANFAECERLRVLSGQLQTALDSRVVIEQAKGILAERRGLTVDEAFAILRKVARENNLRLHDVARATVRTVKTRPA